MEVKKKIMEYYYRHDGKTPFKEWLYGLKDWDGRAKIRNYLDRLESGNFNNTKFLGNGVYELKIHFGPGYRVYFGLANSKTVLLILGGDKKTQPKDIEKAKKCWKEYKEKKYESND